MILVQFEIGDIPEFDWEQAKQRLPVAILKTAKELVAGVVRYLNRTFGENGCTFVCS